MSQATRGSDKLKEKCESMASLSAEEINQIAGGYAGEFKWWMIRGIPADIFRVQPQLPVDLGGFKQGF